MRRPWQGFALFHTFHSVQVASHDVDPVYPVLRHVLCSATPAQRVWLALLHVAYYDLGSALAVYAAYPTPHVPPAAMLKLPCGTERRAHRDPRVLERHLRALVDLHHLHGGLDAWLENHALTGYPAANATFMGVWGNGRWASYKSCELLAQVLGHAYPGWSALLPTDMGHANSSGPRHGLGLLLPDLPAGNSPDAIAYLDAVSTDLCSDIAALGTPAEIPTVETSLCDFHGLVGGRYYPGHDIDQMQTQLDRTPSKLTAAAYKARRDTLPENLLGELCGWQGVRPELRRSYARYAATGTLPTRLQHDASVHTEKEPA